MTPVGHTTVARKVAGPVWHPTPRMRKENPLLPASVGPGPDNPMGAFALYLGWARIRDPRHRQNLMRSAAARLPDASACIPKISRAYFRPCPSAIR